LRVGGKADRRCQRSSDSGKKHSTTSSTSNGFHVSPKGQGPCVTRRDKSAKRGLTPRRERPKRRRTGPLASLCGSSSSSSSSGTSRALTRKSSLSSNGGFSPKAGAAAGCAPPPVIPIDKGRAAEPAVAAGSAGAPGGPIPECMKADGAPKEERRPAPYAYVPGGRSHSRTARRRLSTPSSSSSGSRRPRRRRVARPQPLGPDASFAHILGYFWACCIAFCTKVWAIVAVIWVAVAVWLTWFLSEALIYMVVHLFGGLACWLYDLIAAGYDNACHHVRRLIRRVRRSRRRRVVEHAVAVAMGTPPEPVQAAVPSAELLAAARPLVATPGPVANHDAHVATIVASMSRRFGDSPFPQVYNAVLYASRELGNSLRSHAAVVGRLRALPAQRAHAAWRSVLPRWFNERFTGGGVSGWLFGRSG
jgi:hypothetical protein